MSSSPSVATTRSRSRGSLPTGGFRIFGAHAGFSALFAAYVTSARCVIPEVRYDVGSLADVLAADHRASPSRYAIVVTAEGAVWEGGGRPGGRRPRRGCRRDVQHRTLPAPLRRPARLADAPGWRRRLRAHPPARTASPRGRPSLGAGDRPEG